MLESLRVEALGSPSELPELDARTVGRTAEQDVLSLSPARDRAFDAFYAYLTVDEPAVHLMPLHFKPRETRTAVSPDALLALGVAAKLEYARNRWLDEIVDERCAGSLAAVHHLDGEIIDLIIARYASALPTGVASLFFATLARLNARHGASLAVDGAPSWERDGALDARQYMAHARCRHGSFRGSVDAILLLGESPVETYRRATEAWHMWALGVQFWDDALDVEEDFASGNLTWTVSLALTDLDFDPDGHRSPGCDEFYESALRNGTVIDTLTKAEECFQTAAQLAEREFPRWAALQRACIEQTDALRRDFQRLAVWAPQR